MPPLNKKTVYAIQAVLDIAAHGDVPLYAHRIAERHRIPKRYLEHVLQNLSKNHILRSIRGTHGGYRLARNPSHITLADIIKAVVPVSSHTVKDSSPLAEKILYPLWQEMEYDSMKKLATITVQDMFDVARTEITEL